LRVELKEIGIHTEAATFVGPIVAYQCICARHPGKAVPVCYYLYSLEGALRNQPWDDIGVAIKQNLLRQVSSGKGYATEAHIERGGKIISREILCNESTSRMS
jgi:DNA transformation protein